MTREIKFRAWDTLNKEMTYFPLFERSTACYGKNCEIMQFTGLLDKNGKEIYEGDIVKFSGNERQYKVAWSMGGFHAIPTEIALRLKSSADDWRGVGYTDCEIIGNIYENPELLSTLLSGEREG